MKWMFWIQGAGELSLCTPVIDYVIAKGDTVKTFIDAETLSRGMVRPEDYINWDVSEFDMQNAVPTLANNVQLRQPDVLFFSPSRGWQSNLPPQYVQHAKLKVTLEANLQFRGVGVSYKLDIVNPVWIDRYFYAGNERFFREAMKLHYGKGTLPADIEGKIHATGFFGRKLDRKAGDYVFVYLGGGLTKNDGLLQQVVDNLPTKQKVIAVSNDALVGNYPNVEKYNGVEDFDSLLAGCDYFIGHEALGTINKCLVNGIPYVSIRGDRKMKMAECDASNILKYGRVITLDQISPENLAKPKATTQESGVEEMYKIISNSL